jgi:RimJ/RimL family protein N-acetyltransferase
MFTRVRRARAERLMLYGMSDTAQRQYVAGPMPSFPGLEQPLSDGVVSVRRSAERDIPEVLIAYQDDRGLHLALGEDRPPSGAALGRRAELAELDLLEGRAMTFTVLRAGSDICRGEVRVSDVDWERRRADLRVWVAPAIRRQGIGSAAHALVREWLRRECGLAGECPARAQEGV